MTITFFSNFLNHHQLPICLEIIKSIGENNFHFVACEKIHEERTNMGYEDMNIKYPFVVRAYESVAQHAKSLALAESSDVAIIGSSPLVYSEIRANNNKLTFLFRERIFKNGTWHRFLPTTVYKIYKGYYRFRSKNFYVLCASAYAVDDLVKCWYPREKCLKWGYFPELIPKVEKSFDKLRIMWCGRMIWWKHPEVAIEVARILKEKKIPFEMQMIGNGDKRMEIENLIGRYGLSNDILVCDFMSPANIRKTMNESNMYLFTSGKQEGWGVVLNEALNSGCVVIANENAGSSPYLIDDCKNGFLYDGTIVELRKAIERLEATNLKSVSDAAFETMYDTWNPTVATSNLMKFIESFNMNHKCNIQFGPCSKA